MQETDSTYEPSVTASRRKHPLFRRLFVLLGLIVVMILIALIVPFINVNRFQRRIVTSLSESIGRPIHLDRISLTVLPLPGLTIDNLVVAEDPAFGAEPFVRASSVRATLRISSLWRRRIEFTRISFTDPSINLVKTGSGKWNLESILLQAAQINAAPTDAAPTDRHRANGAPRFPYIEASGARFNLKIDREKAPLSLTEADFALWLSSPQEWRLRLVGRPVRTDTSVSDTGTFQMEGTLGHAKAFDEVPIELKTEWRNVPLGEASRVVLGHDAGLRGSLTLSSNIRGTIGQSATVTRLHLADLRRADFVPLHPLSLDAECLANESESFRTVSNLRCSWPPAATLLPSTLAVTGSIPDTHQLSTAAFDMGTPGIPAATLLQWLHVASARVSPDLSAMGSLTGSLSLRPDAHWGGQLTIADGSLVVPAISPTPIFTGAVTLRPTPERANLPAQFVLSPLSLTLGDRDFATLDGHFDGTGYVLHLTGTADPAKLRALATALPPLGDGLSDVLPTTVGPVRFDLTSSRSWTGPQTWTSATRRGPGH